MLVILSLVFVISTFCFNFNVTLPVLAKVTLNGHSYVYGLLSAAFGVGALVGALAAASLGRASMKALLDRRARLRGGELLLAPVHSALLAGVLLFFVGAGFTAWSANSNAIMQLAAPDHLRGRVIGLYFYAFNGTGAIAGIMTGWLCAVGGTELAFVVAGLIGLVAVIATALCARLDAAHHDAPPRRAAAARLMRRGSRRPAFSEDGRSDQDEQLPKARTARAARGRSRGCSIASAGTALAPASRDRVDAAATRAGRPDAAGASKKLTAEHEARPAETALSPGERQITFRQKTRDRDAGFGELGL